MHKQEHPHPDHHPSGEGRGEGVWLQKRHASSLKAKTLRQNQTETEKIIWHKLKAKRFFGYKFKRQFPVGPYFADFICLEKKLILEIDGGQHNESKKDQLRTEFLEGKGYEIIRFWNNEILENIEGVLHTLSLTLSRTAGEGTEENTPSPALAGEGWGEGGCDGPQ